MKAVLLSIQPKWCEKIAQKIKKIEVRKTKPNLKVPFKCFIYCSTDKNPKMLGCYDTKNKRIGRTFPCNVKTAYSIGFQIISGKVIGEFVCDRIDKYECHNELPYDKYNLPKSVLKSMCLICHGVDKYGKGKPLHGWRISDLKIYDKPKELSEFKKPYPVKCGKGYESIDCTGCGSEFTCTKRFITSPPQSWCYVEV